MSMLPKILSYRQQIIADHSSTNYLFYSAKALTEEAQKAVSKLSSHVDVEDNTAQITYHGESDMESSRPPKFLQYYEVMVRESYDWWDIHIMLDPQKLKDIDLSEYEASDGEATLTFEKVGKKLRLELSGCHLDYSECDEDAMEGLAELAIKIRKELYTGKTDALNIMAAYCRGESMTKSKALSPAAKVLFEILEFSE